jgi:hypothetical protein
MQFLFHAQPLSTDRLQCELAISFSERFAYPNREAWSHHQLGKDQFGKYLPKALVESSPSC